MSVNLKTNKTIYSLAICSTDGEEAAGSATDESTDDDSDDEEANAKAMDLNTLAEKDPEFYNFLQAGHEIRATERVHSVLTI